jgi:NAD(P)H-flavin reductase
MVATIAEAIPVSPRARLVVLDLQAAVFPFSAGQAVLVGAHGQSMRRPYSIACSPECAAGSRRIELLIGVGPGTTTTPLLLQVGATVDVEGPIGTFTLPARFPQRRLLFVAGGTGIAPVRSMLDHLRRRHESIEMALLYSARRAEDLVFLDEWRALAAVGRLDLYSTITRADADWDGVRGRLRRCHVEAFLGNRHDTLCFICGPPSLVSDTQVILADLGVPREAVRTEEWARTPASDCQHTRPNLTTAEST